MNRDFYRLMEENPVIAAVKDEEGLDICCKSRNIRVVFVLYGTVSSISGIVKRIKEAEKVAMVHIDLMEGLNGKEPVVDFIRQYTEADGIISTKPSLIRHARELGMYTVLRVFILDSLSFKNVPRQVSAAGADMLEMLPGLMPKMIERVRKTAKIPVIAGGLLSDKEDVMAALAAGAISISTTDPAVWDM